MLSLLLSVTVSAQGQDEKNDSLYKLLTTLRMNDCYDFEKNAKVILPRLYSENKRDSALLIIEYIRQNCVAYPFRQIKLLMEVEEGKITQDWCDSLFLAQILPRQPVYRPFFLVTPEYAPARRSGRYGFPEYVSDSTYNAFMRNMTESIMAKTDSNTVGYLVCRYYLDDIDYIYKRLARGDFPGTCLQAEYNRQVAELRPKLNNMRPHLSLLGGAWSPLGANKSLGNKIEFGFQVGGKTNHLGFDINFIGRFGSAKEPYTIVDGDNIGTTKRFGGGYVGGNMTYNIIRHGRYDAELFFGIGYDGFDDPRSDDDAETPHGVNAFSKNFGLTQRIFTSRDRVYWGIQLRYNMVSYRTGGGSDLSGNTLSLVLVYGYLGQPGARKDLENLGQVMGRQ